ncbi:MAG TPA: HEAT repeat domain-containing protein [Dehalococcoidia bacterium]|jgi:HEAT repeat protein|nr:HEAT repeat domain-containing protein [Dehalococcoidia bacterium]
MDFSEYLDEISDGSRRLSSASLQRFSRLEKAERDELDRRWNQIDVRRRRRVMQELVELAEDNVDMDFDAVFLRGLQDSDSDVRLEALRGLWDAESPDLIDSLVALMEQDKNPEVRAEAALALGRFVLLSELGRLRERHFERVEAALHRVIDSTTEAGDVRARAIEAIGAYDSAWVRQAIQNAYESGERSLKVSAVHAMGRSAQSRWLPLLVRELSSDDTELRYEAAIAIGQVAEESAIPHLLPLLTDEDEEVRGAAVAALGEIGGERAKSALMEMLDSSSSATREAAAAALSEIEFEEDPLGFRFRQ